MSQQQVQPFSTQWLYITFRLQMLLAKPNIQLTALRKKTPSFPSHLDPFIKIDGAIDATDIDGPSLASIKDGMKKDLVIRTGKLAGQSTDTKRKFRILLVKVAIQQILPVFRESYLSGEDFFAQYPQYDSVYVSPRRPEGALFAHEYMVREPQQCQWEYQAECEIGEFVEWKAQMNLCQNCHLNPAKFYCPQDKEIYCWPCYGDLHRSDRRAKFAKEPISPYNCPPKCQKSLHQNEPLTFYCFSCKQLKCPHCLQDWQHQANPNNKQQQAQHQVMENRQLVGLFRDKEQQLVSQLKIKITALLREVEGKIQTRSGHYDLQVKQFIRAFEEKTEAARRQAVQYLNEATGLHCELKKKYDEVLWLQSFSEQMEQRCGCEAGMQAKQGLSQYLNRSFSQDYFVKVDKRLKELKDFA